MLAQQGDAHPGGYLSTPAAEMQFSPALSNLGGLFYLDTPKGIHTMTLEQAMGHAWLYVTAGKLGDTMPKPLKGREQACKDAYNYGIHLRLLKDAGK